MNNLLLRWFLPLNACRILAVLALIAACVGIAAAAESPFDPVADDPKLPRVLLIGDSISIGYTLPVRHLLEGKANVHRIPVNGQYSAYGLSNIKEWLGNGKWDVIHFNWGIWDTHMIDSNGELIHSKDEGRKQGKIRTPIAEYQKNLNRILDILERSGARLIWASSTPLTCVKGERLKDIGRYNNAAESVMRARHVAIDDLNAHIKPRLSKMQSDDGCHFTLQGYDYLGKHVAESILPALGTVAKSSAAWDAKAVGEESIAGQRVVRYEHDCRKEWGYAEKTTQYFYVVEPKIKDNGPLLVCLHSAGGNPDKFENGKLEMPDNAARIAAAGDDFTGLVVNSGIDSDWWWGADEIQTHPHKYKSSLTPAEIRILATIEWVVEKYKIDRNRIYLRGISMGGSGTLGIGMCHGDIFAALLAGVPAGTDHAIYRLQNSSSVGSQAGTLNDVPPVCVFFSQKDDWSKGMEAWLDLMHRNKMSLVAAWGPWGHLSHYEMTNPAAFEFPWLSIRKDQAYPAFTNTSADEKYPGFHSDAPDQNGQMNAFFRWNVIEDQPRRFAIELKLVQNRELAGTVKIPAEVTTDVTMRRLQRLRVKAGRTYNWKIEQAGQLIAAGAATADDQALITVPGIKVTAKPIVLLIKDNS